MANSFFKNIIKKYSNIHINDGKKSVMVFSTPRSGSTWLMELIWSQPGFKYCNEPLNLRNSFVRKNLGIDHWEQLYDHRFTKKILDYFKKINDGQIRDLNPNPFNEFYKFKTDRIVFKIIQGMEDRVQLLSTYCNAIPLLLTRHPLAVSVSREVLPMLEFHFLKDFSANIPASIIKEARKIVDSGNFIDKAVVSWCFENYYPLKDVQENKYMCISYEEMILDPEYSVSILAPYLDLKDENKIIKYLTKPSKTTNKSDAQTKKIISENYTPDLILNKWKKKVTSQNIKSAQNILDLFEIDLYMANEARPAKLLQKHN